MSDEQRRHLWRQVLESQGTDLVLLERYVATLRRDTALGAVYDGPLVMGQSYVAIVAAASERKDGCGVTLRLTPLSHDGRLVLGDEGKAVVVIAGFRTEGPYYRFREYMNALFPDEDRRTFDLDELVDRMVRVSFEPRIIRDELCVVVKTIASLTTEERVDWRSRYEAAIGSRTGP